MTPITLPEFSEESPPALPQPTIEAAVPVDERETDEPPPDPEMEEADLAIEEGAVELGETPSEEPLLSLDEAVKRIPEDLHKQMVELLRAEFREVTRWQPPKGG